jgi:hypothetical protein
VRTIINVKGGRWFGGAITAALTMAVLTAAELAGAAIRGGRAPGAADRGARRVASVRRLGGTE